jgi:hypothetical protein
VNARRFTLEKDDCLKPFGEISFLIGALICFVSLKTRIANLLGVAGADIPVADIKKLMQPFLVSFMSRMTIISKELALNLLYHF